MDNSNPEDTNQQEQLFTIEASDDDEGERLDQTGTHISETERRSMVAERDTNDRYLAAFLSDRVGAEFPGRISGVQRFGAHRFYLRHGMNITSHHFQLELRDKANDDPSAG